MPRYLFLLYELGHVEQLQRYFRENPEERKDSFVVAFSIDIEDQLMDLKIPFSSARNYKNILVGQLDSEDKMISAFFADKRWSKFIYRDITLPTIFQFMFRSYFQRVRYYANLLIPIFNSHPTITSIILFSPSVITSKTFGILANKEIFVVVDCAKIIASAFGVKVSLVPLPIDARSLFSYARPIIFNLKRSIFGLILRVWNTIVKIIRPSSHPRLVISDHWRNVGDSIKLLKNAECVFIDRTEIQHINWRTLFHYRMRFVHVDNFLSRSMRLRARISAKEFKQLWKDVRDSMQPIFLWHGYSFDSLLLNSMDNIADNFEKILCEIEGTYELYKKIHPDVVLLRASVSAQTHFSILPLVAKKNNIPSLELQHGIEYLGPGSISREHVAEYLAVYGHLVKQELLTMGYVSEKVREIGSPRFDYYIDKASNRKTKDENGKEKFTVLCIAPDIRPFEIYDSYSAFDYFKSVVEALGSTKEAHVIIKLRHGPVGERMFHSIIKRVFSGMSYSISQYESLPDLYAQTDVVISCFSTVILEALQFGIPVVVPALNPVDDQVVRFHFSQYSDAGVLSIISTREEFASIVMELSLNFEKRQQIRIRIEEFMSCNFCFDGNSSQRYANLIIELSKC